MTITIILIILFLIIVGYVYVINKVRKTPMVENHQKIIVLEDKNFDAIIKNKTILVDFWAAWCMPCKMIAPVLNEIAEELPEGKFIGKVDVEKFPGLSNRFKIRGIPTLILFKNGKEIERFVGVKSKTALKSRLLEA
jgi:thioredoxin 1